MICIQLITELTISFNSVFLCLLVFNYIIHHLYLNNPEDKQGDTSYKQPYTLNYKSVTLKLFRTLTYPLKKENS